MAKRTAKRDITVKVEICDEAMTPEEWQSSERILARLVARVYLAEIIQQR